VKENNETIFVDNLWVSFCDCVFCCVCLVYVGKEVMAKRKDTEAGWIVELESGCWMVSATADPLRTLKQENATRWPTLRAAQRAVGRMRKCGKRPFKNLQIQFVAAVTHERNDTRNNGI
jgi:hypothetical protein